MGLEDAIIELATAYEFGDVHWYPSQYTVVYRLDERVPLTSSGDGVFRYLGFQPIPGAQIGAVRATGKHFTSVGLSINQCCVVLPFLTEPWVRFRV
jgi:hypothetical protein